MKKIVIIIGTILIVLICGIKIYITKNNSAISSTEAFDIAKNDVSNPSGNYTLSSIEYVKLNDENIYNIVFNDDYNVYTYKINSKTKEIISGKREIINDNSRFIDKDEMLEIIYKHANLNKYDCNLVVNDIKYEDGNPYYNTIFYSNGIKYQYKSNAYTGAIISVIKIDENNSNES